MRIEVRDAGVTVIDKHQQSAHKYDWKQVQRFQQDTLVTEYVYRDRLWLWVPDGDGQRRVEIETAQDNSSEHKHFLRVRELICERLRAAGVPAVRPTRWGRTDS